jgi:hypothetical protein
MVKMNKTPAEDAAAKALAELLLAQNRSVIEMRALAVGIHLGSTSSFCALIVHRSHESFDDLSPHAHSAERSGENVLLMLRPALHVARQLRSTGSSNMATSIEHDESHDALPFDGISVVISVHQTYNFRTVIQVPGVPPCPACSKASRRMIH